MLPLPSTILVSLVIVLYSFLLGVKSTQLRLKICYLHPSEGGLRMLSVGIRQHKLRIAFLDQICTQSNGVGEFWKEDTPKNFPSLRRSPPPVYPKASIPSVRNVESL